MVYPKDLVALGLLFFLNSCYANAVDSNYAAG
jgi:hypothetical protein